MNLGDDKNKMGYLQRLPLLNVVAFQNFPLVHSHSVYIRNNNGIFQSVKVSACRGHYLRVAVLETCRYIRFDCYASQIQGKKTHAYLFGIKSIELHAPAVITPGSEPNISYFDSRRRQPSTSV